MSDGVGVFLMMWVCSVLHLWFSQRPHRLPSCFAIVATRTSDGTEMLVLVEFIPRLSNVAVNVLANGETPRKRVRAL